MTDRRTSPSVAMTNSISSAKAEPECMRHPRGLRRFIIAMLLATLAASAHSAEIQDVSFAAKGDGSEQRYVLILPDRLDGAAPVSLLIAFHGHGADRWQFVRDGRDECRAAREAAAKRRMIFVSPDYRAKTSWMGPAAEADMLQIIDELKDRFKVDKVILCGGSMGGTAALTFAALHPDCIDGLVSMNGTANLVEFDRFQDAIAASFGGSKAGKPEEYRKRSAELNADKLKMPIAITAGGRDTVVPPESVVRLTNVLRKQDRHVRLIHAPEGGHATNFADATAAFDFVLDAVLSPNQSGQSPTSLPPSRSGQP
jgi:pimeloyl-ACP methyl ester carboxylesterase